MEKIFTFIHWDPSPEITPWNLPLLNRPILWYGFFFAFGVFLSFLVYQKLLRQFLKTYRISRRISKQLAEKTVLYVIVGTILGARLGEVLFYQSPMQYVHDPFGIFRFWEGGLSSHGGVIGILFAIWVYCQNVKKKYPMLTWVAMLDLLSIPALLAGAFIRIGNFFNQEILGKFTDMPWAVIFGHPADGSVPMPRHPVQLYEALFYLSFFFVLYALRTKLPKMFQLGKTSGLFFMVVFSFRFIIEFFKAQQSVHLEAGSLFNMGQLLSLPLILFGAILFFFVNGRRRQLHKTKST